VAIKASTLIIAASLTANAALVAVVAINSPWVLHLGPSISPATVQVAAARPAAAAEPPGGQAGQRTWASLKGEDLKSLVARLRATGFPPGVIRAIVKAQLDEQLRAQRKELVDRTGSRPYWSARFGNFDPKTLTALRNINIEENKTIRDLVGTDDDPGNPFGNAFRQDSMSGLSKEKYSSIQAIQSDFNEMRNNVYGDTNGVMLPEDKEKMDYLQKEEKAEIAAELSPEELFEYQLRTSNTAGQLRSKLSAFNPTEDEFRAIFKAQQDFDKQYGSVDEPLSPDQQKEREAHQPELLAKIQDAVGPDRMADYRMQTDPNYQQVSRLVDRLELPAAATQQVVEVQSEISKRADAIRKDPSLSDADRGSQLAALADEATGRITAVMGDRGMEAYKQNGGGWLQALKPPSN
jgi:hypothetical protein